MSVIRFPPRPRAPISKREILELVRQARALMATEAAHENAAYGDSRNPDDPNVRTGPRLLADRTRTPERSPTRKTRRRRPICWVPKEESR